LSTVYFDYKHKSGNFPDQTNHTIYNTTITDIFVFSA